MRDGTNNHNEHIHLMIMMIIFIQLIITMILIPVLDAAGLTVRDEAALTSQHIHDPPAGGGDHADGHDHNHDNDDDGNEYDDDDDDNDDDDNDDNASGHDVGDDEDYLLSYNYCK